MREIDSFWDDLGTKEMWRSLFLLPFFPLAVLSGSLLLYVAFRETIAAGEG